MDCSDIGNISHIASRRATSAHMDCVSCQFKKYHFSFTQESKLKLIKIFSRVCSLVLILLAATVLNKTKGIFHKARDTVWAILAGAICLGLVDGRQFFSWAILIGTPILIWISPIDPNKRIRSIIFSLHCLLCLLSASYEPFFFIILSAHLLSWHVPPTSEMPKNKTRQDEAMSLKDMVDAAFLVSFFKMFKRHYSLLRIYAN